MAFGYSAVRDFESALREIEEGVEFVRAATRLRPRLGKLVRWETLEADGKTLVAAFLDRKDFVESRSYSGYVVVLAACFEEFVRGLIQAAVEKIAQSARSYDDIPEKLKNQNINLTGHALLTALNPPDHFKIDYWELVSNLVTCKAGADAFLLNPAAFALDVSNVTPANLGRILERIDFNFDWDNLGRLPAMQELLGTEGTKTTANASENFLLNFIRIRNQVAHAGIGGRIVTEEEVRKSIEYFCIAAPCLAKAIEARF